MPVIRSTAMTRVGGTRRHCLIASMLILHVLAMASRSFVSAMSRITASRFDDLDIRVFHRLLLQQSTLLLSAKFIRQELKKVPDENAMSGAPRLALSTYSAYALALSTYRSTIWSSLIDHLVDCAIVATFR